MASTKEFTKSDLVEMASHVSSKDVSNFSREQLLSFVKEAISKLKPKVSKITFPAIVVYENVANALVDAGLQLLSFAGSKAVFGIPSGKTGIKLVSVTDATKKNRRKLVVHFGADNLSSDVFELVHDDKGTRTCGSQSQEVLVIDSAIMDAIETPAFKEEITRLATATRDSRHESMKRAAAAKVAEKIDAKFTS